MSVADVDPEVVEVEIRCSGEEEFVVKKRDSDGEWLEKRSSKRR